MYILGAKNPFFQIRMLPPN